MITRLAFCLAVTLSLSGFAQDLAMPRPSPLAKVTQTVGYTDLTVEYSSPGVKGRKIYGALLPFGELWRAGANRATKLTVSQEVTIGTTPVPAGSYAIFVIPNKTAFTFIINKDFNQGGTGNYKKELDVVRVDVKPQTISQQERLAYGFSDFEDGMANLDLSWEKTRISLPIKLGTDAQVASRVKVILEGSADASNAAARYLFESKKDLDQAMAAADRSIALKESWSNLWTKAQITNAKGNAKEAIALAQKAQAMGEKTPAEFFSADDVKKALATWKPKP